MILTDTRFIKVKDAPAVRDTNSGAILFNDDRSYRQALLRKKIRQETEIKNQTISSLNSVIESVKADMARLVQEVNAMKHKEIGE